MDMDKYPHSDPSEVDETPDLPTYPWNDRDNIYDWYVINEKGELVPYTDISEALEAVPENSLIGPVPTVSRDMDLPINPDTKEFYYVGLLRGQVEEQADAIEKVGSNEGLVAVAPPDGGTVINAEKPAEGSVMDAVEETDPASDPDQLTFDQVLAPTQTDEASQVVSPGQTEIADNAYFKFINDQATSLAKAINGIKADISYYDSDAYAESVRSGREQDYPDTFEMARQMAELRTELVAMLSSNLRYLDELKKDAQISAAIAGTELS